MAQLVINSGTDTAALRTALDAAGYEDVDIVEGGGEVSLDVPEEFDALRVDLLARTVYRADLVDRLGGTEDFEGAAADAIETKLAQAANLSDLDDVPTARTNLGLGTAATYNVGTSSGELPALGAGGKLPSSLLPAIAITDTFAVASQAAMLALTAETGDVAIRTDLNKSFILQGTDPATLSQWKELLTPTDTVQSVNGQTGTVTIAAPTYARVTGSNATTTSTSLVDITGLSVALEANSTYEVEVFLSANTSADINGIKYALNFSAAGASVEAWLTPGVFTSNNAFRTDRISAFNTATGNRYLQTSGQDGFIVIRGTVSVGANAGNLTAQHLKDTTGTSTVRVGSFLKVTKIA